MTPWQRGALVALAGALGTLARFGTSASLGPFWGTLTVNVVGCFLAGGVSGSSGPDRPLPADVALTASVGFLGAFTTFSTLMLDVVITSADHRLRAGLTLLAHLALGVGATLVGLAVGRRC